MSNAVKNQQGILNKLGIEELNPMQQEAQLAIHSTNEVLLLSPTGTGKTLAYLLPLIAELDMNCEEVQMLILVPSRELAIQIEQVIREMGSGYKVNAVYGGRSGFKDKMDLKHRPAILVGTPGRVSDHLRRDRFPTEDIKTLVLDEFDKSLEVGFEEEMKDIAFALNDVQKKVLTSATNKVAIPEFMKVTSPIVVDYLHERVEQLELKRVISPNKDKLATLVDTLKHIGNQPGIIFCNFKDSIRRVSEFLHDHNINHGCFFGGMEQVERERALVKFRNGTHQVLLATDLAARGLDIPEIKFIIHYHLPPRSQEFTHRNGRTARMNSDGTAYIIQWENEQLPDFIPLCDVEELDPTSVITPSQWTTVHISGGRKDKISKGDIAGFLFKQAGLNKDEIGTIELAKEYAYVAVSLPKVVDVLRALDNNKLKKKKVRVTQI